ncbi:MAG: hypothetical protein LUC22_03700 [Prevotella sp.]|nr:hypothetical protein [Prevotella sp.]
MKRHKHKLTPYVPPATQAVYTGPQDCFALTGANSMGNGTAQAKPTGKWEEDIGEEPAGPW